MNTMMFMNKNSNMVSKKSLPSMGAIYASSIFPLQTYNIVQSPQVVDTPEPTVPAKPISWGAPTWFLFHTLAEKIKTEAFSFLKTELLNMIYLICVNLPCPDCAAHAKGYLNGINFNTIQTKEDLKKMLFVFHNSVNEMKKFPIFSYENLTDKYKRAITNNMVSNFTSRFRAKTNNMKLLSSELQRTNVIQKFTTWFSARSQYFDE
jgi:hypothetical protein